MISEKYLQIIKEKILDFSQDKDQRWFIFGSSLKKKHFGDVDLGVIGKVNDSEIAELKEWFENSVLPFKIDIVVMNKTKNDFKNNVLNNEILWIKH